MASKPKQTNLLEGASAGRSVAELLEHFRLRPETHELLPRLESLPTRAAFQELLQRGIYADAIRLLAIALPKPAAVWWGTLCAWDLYRDPKPELMPEPSLAEAALAAAFDWVRYPREVTRRAAERVGRQAKASTAAGALALAAAWSGGSLAPAGLPDVPPAWFLTGKLTAGSLLLSAACQRPYELHFHYRRYLRIGLEIASGKLLWPTLSSTELAELLGGEDSSESSTSRRSLPARRLLDNRGDSQEYLLDSKPSSPSTPHLQTTLLTAREQLAQQLAQIDQMINSGQFA